MGVEAVWRHSTVHFESWNVGTSRRRSTASNQWGKGYFRINPSGKIRPIPTRTAREASTFAARRTSVKMVYHPPCSFVPGILRTIPDSIRPSNDASTRGNYMGGYQCVVPDQVNQQAHVVEEVLRFGRVIRFCVEAGFQVRIARGAGARGG